MVKSFPKLQKYRSSSILPRSDIWNSAVPLVILQHIDKPLQSLFLNPLGKKGLIPLEKTAITNIRYELAPAPPEVEGNTASFLQLLLLHRKKLFLFVKHCLFPGSVQRDLLSIKQQQPTHLQILAQPFFAKPAASVS